MSAAQRRSTRPPLPRTAAPALAAVAVLGLVSCAGPSADTGAGTRSETVEVGSQLRFEVEIADTPQEREQGLSGRSDLPEGTGMLFTYDEARTRSFWMVDMLLPIDLAWIRGDRLVAVQTLQPCPTREACPSHLSPEPVDAVLEVGAGALEQVTPQTPVVLPR